MSGNDLADTAAKLVATSFEEIPTQNFKSYYRQTSRKTTILGMYTSNPIIPPIPLSTGPRSLTLRQPWWTIPETEKRCM
jgi:hypothetical protein